MWYFKAKMHQIRFRLGLRPGLQRIQTQNVSVSSDYKIEQEAPLTLRGQRGRCRNIKGKPQIFGSFPSPRLRPILLWVWFYGGPWQTQAVYQIWSRYSFSHCVNIEMNPQISGSSPEPCLPFLLRVILSWALANPSCVPNLKSLALAVAGIV